MRLFKRKIRIGVLLGRGIYYRLFIIGSNLLFNLIAFRGLLSYLARNDVIESLFTYYGTAVAYTVLWNLVNMALYYLFHYCFDRNVKMGKG